MHEQGECVASGGGKSEWIVAGTVSSFQFQVSSKARRAPLSHTYRDLLVWQKAVTLVKDVYLETREFPKLEVYGLAAQMRRSAVSVPSNIAEGQGRLSKGEFRQFLGVARGSLLELETQIIIATYLHYIEEARSEPLVSRTQEVLRMLNGLIESPTLNRQADSRGVP